MAKAVWTGSLSFGLVNVPVGLYSATEDRSIHFNQFRAGTSERIRNKRVGEQSGRRGRLLRHRQGLRPRRRRVRDPHPRGARLGRAQDRRARSR